MTHAELFQDVHGRYRWLAIEPRPNGDTATVSEKSFATAEEAYADALHLSFTVLSYVRESATTREVTHDEAIAPIPRGNTKPTRTPPVARTPPDLFKWAVGFVVATSGIAGWFLLGQPGAPLKNGDYRCELKSALSLGLPSIDAPAATVRGNVVDEVWDLDFRTGEKTFFRYSDVEHKGRKKFSMTSVAPRSGVTNTFVCTAD
jgi:hypothetical protein